MANERSGFTPQKEGQLEVRLHVEIGVLSNNKALVLLLKRDKNKVGKIPKSASLSSPISLMSRF